MNNRWEDELDEEIRFHLEMSKQQKMKAGMTEAAAKRAALRDFGGVEQYKEKTRDAWGWRIIRDTMQDIRYGLRQMWRNKGFSTVVILTLGLCLGANTAAMSLLKNLILEPYAYKDTRNVVLIGTRYLKIPEYANGISNLSIPQFRYIEENQTVFESLGFIDPYLEFDMEAEGGLERIPGDRVTPGVWEATGVEPIRGRTFTQADLDTFGSRVAVISERLYRRVLGAGQDVFADDIRLDGNTYKVVGVMPESFYLNIDRSDVWIPRDIYSVDAHRNNHSYWALGRLKAGHTLEQASIELDQLFKSYSEQYPEDQREVEVTGKTFDGIPVNDVVTAQVPMIKTAFISFQVVTLMVLIIGCLNVSGMIMVRGLARLRELAIRHSLGAGRFRLARQLLTEVALLFFFGLLVSYLVFDGFIHLTYVLQLDEIPWGQSFSLDYNLFWLSLGLAAVLTVLTGSLPVIGVLRSNLQGLIQANALTHSGGKGKHRFHAFFVMGQIAFSTLLLVLSGVSLLNLRAVLERDLGFERQGRVGVSVPLPSYRFGRDQAAYLEQKEPFRRRALERLSELPGVIHVSAANRIPGSIDDMGHSDFTMPHYTIGENEVNPNALRNNISPGFFETIGSDIVLGRDFADTDTWESQKVVIVSENVVDRYFKDLDPLGMQIRFWGNDLTIVGVVEEIQDKPFFIPETDFTLYFPLSQWEMYAYATTFILNIQGRPEAYIDTIRQAMLEVDPNLTMTITTFEEVFGLMVFAQELPMQLTTLFSVLALFLTAIGLYGLVSYVVAERTREFGIRMAIGATPRSILSMVGTWSIVWVLLGLFFGIAAGAVVCFLLTPVFTDINPMNPWVFVSAAAIIAIVAVLASLKPALRAVRVDPARALRWE